MNFQPAILIDRTFSSDREELRSIPELLEQVRDRCRLDDVQFFNLVVALTEAVNNAIVHGNRGNPKLSVRYLVECRDDGVYCAVEDQGEGFDPDAIADPTDPANIMREGGRGLFLIHALMQDVRSVRTTNGMRIEFLCPRQPR